MRPSPAAPSVSCSRPTRNESPGRSASSCGRSGSPPPPDSPTAGPASFSFGGRCIVRGTPGWLHCYPAAAGTGHGVSVSACPGTARSAGCRASYRWKHPPDIGLPRLGVSVSAFHPARRSAVGRGRASARSFAGLPLTRSAAEGGIRRGRRGRRRATSWRTGWAGRGCVGGRWCARQTGEGQPVEVRRKEGVTDHLHPESCVGRCEAAGEALTGARMDPARRGCREAQAWPISGFELVDED